MILNSDQQARLWNLVNGGGAKIAQGIGGGQVEFVLRGKELYGVLRNFGREQSRIGKDIGIK